MIPEDLEVLERLAAEERTEAAAMGLSAGKWMICDKPDNAAGRARFAARAGLRVLALESLMKEKS